MRSLFHFAAIAASLLSLSACATLGAVDDGSDFQIAGFGSPTLVLESGLGDGLASWDPVFDSLAALTRTFRYSCAGYGRNPAAADPRSSLAIVADLRAALQAEGLQPPYVLVGHSLGGILVQSFVRQYPDEVAGVVLLDPTTREILDAQEDAQLPLLLRIVAPKGMRQEWAARRQSTEEMEALPPFPNIPLVVVSSDPSTAEQADNAEQLMAAQLRVSEQSTLGEHIIAEGSGHYVHHDAPAVVIDTVRLTLELTGSQN